jgi:hypothetical protein
VQRLFNDFVSDQELNVVDDDVFGQISGFSNEDSVVVDPQETSVEGEQIQ